MISFPVIIPVKTFDLAKQRLSGILQPPERAALARTMLIDVLNVVASVVLPSNVIVITSGPEASGIAKSAGTLVLQEAASSDLNSAIEAATRHVMVQNAGGFLMLPADVPEITIAVLHQALVALDQNGSVRSELGNRSSHKTRDGSERRRLSDVARRRPGNHDRGAAPSPRRARPERLRRPCAGNQ